MLQRVASWLALSTFIASACSSSSPTSDTAARRDGAGAGAGGIEAAGTGAAGAQAAGAAPGVGGASATGVGGAGTSSGGTSGAGAGKVGLSGSGAGARAGGAGVDATGEAGASAGAAGEAGSGSGAAGRAALFNQTIPSFPHLIDFYVPAGATRAMIFLHGALGTKEGFAYDTGVIDDHTPAFDATNWTWLTEHRVIAVFPQGQALPDAPTQTTWTNHVMDSGQDDVGFLQALAADLRSRFGVSQLILSGLSNGGMMTNRMWCESADTFDAFVALSGPPSEYYLMPGQACAPTVNKPYFGMVGELDDILQVTGNFSAPTYTVIGSNAVGYLDPVLIGEWALHVSRSGDVCGADPMLVDSTTKSQIESWSDCGGNVRVSRALGYSHLLGMRNTLQPTQIIDLAIDFVDEQVGVP